MTPRVEVTSWQIVTDRGVTSEQRAPSCGRVQTDSQMDLGYGSGSLLGYHPARSLQFPSPAIVAEAPHSHGSAKLDVPSLRDGSRFRLRDGVARRHSQTSIRPVWRVPVA